jgi:hypothetical protein
MVTLRKVWTVTIIVAIIRAENFNEPILRKMGERYVVVVKKMKNIGGVRGFYASLEADILGRISMVHPPNASENWLLRKPCRITGDLGRLAERNLL